MSFIPTYTSFDEEIWGEELESFVPMQVFDVHCHLWREQDAGSNTDADNALRLPVDGQRMLEWSRQIYPGREMKFYYLGTPIVGCDVMGHDAFLLEESRRHHAPAAALVTPQITAEQTAEFFKGGIAGLKPYRLFADDPAECGIADYLTEAQMEVAEHYHGKITLHLSKRDGIANLDNQRDIAYFTRKYPHVQWILAHCARAFNCFMLERSIDMLADLGENVWIDMSAVCDTYSHYLLFRRFNRKRLMFGSDNIGAGGARGNYITWGRAWSFQGSCQLTHCDGQATLVVYEQLRAMRHAAEMAGLSPEEIRGVFHGNAERLFRMG